ncbi:MAG: YggS family pyridoxal phosphate-dependent enzyme [Clostridia bacterium]|nr:YggS family pyridoxal phosphate-dependent enzyme [Clostridia bacterium]
MSEITNRVKEVLSSVPQNKYGEKVTLVAAVKFRTVEEIQEAIDAGIEAIGDNHVQEFKEKFDSIRGASRQFIGHLQTNKVKYLIGKTDLIQSLDRMELVEELDKRSVRAGVVTNVLVQVNIGCEESKGGFEYGEALERAREIHARAGLNVKGFMAMLPISDDEGYLSSLVEKMRSLYDAYREENGSAEYLSMGMSGDWKLCVEHGSNMIRIGTALFGARPVAKKDG